MKTWICSICGYMHSGEDPPDRCPNCDAPRDDFIEVDDE